MPNHSRRSRFSEIAFLYLFPFLNWAASWAIVQGLLLVRRRSRMAASWSFGCLGKVLISAGAIATSSLSPTPSMMVWVRTSLGAWYSGRSQRICPLRSSSARWALRVTRRSRMISVRPSPPAPLPEGEGSEDAV
ncbi:MAG: hypothetical protein ACK5C4_07355 [Pseudanabaena sp.]